VTDPLDRLNGVVQATGTAATSVTWYRYPSPTQRIACHDQNTYADCALQSKTLYDGLGRAIQSITAESGSQGITTATTYDALEPGLARSGKLRLAPFGLG
jgi:hypothetical protein